MRYIDFFEAEGYQIDSAILNAYEFGVPQLRRRAFILGKLGRRNYLAVRHS
ncbi:DNA cytosine methyltransferase [Bacillus paranthracis]